jgi:hypothetical protein
MNRTIALVVGGSEKVFEEYQAALDLCAGRPTVNFVLNAMIEDFPGSIDYAVTLHPESLWSWLKLRREKGLPEPGQFWAHRPAPHITNHTRDWQGSCSLFAAKIARHIDYEKILLCGCPMTVEDKHFKRHTRWNAAHAFRRGWIARRHELPPRTVRSMSGWTRETFGFPDVEWLDADLAVSKFRPHIIQPPLPR